ncbi:MAG TPA: recombinase family protein [Myxococcota bacterium]|nr:recombinase family protein [Myxococcota bacterium]
MPRRQRPPLSWSWRPDLARAGPGGGLAPVVLLKGESRLYARVSTTEQHVEPQLHALRSYAEARGFDIAAEYVDHGVAGAPRIAAPPLTGARFGRS